MTPMGLSSFPVAPPVADEAVEAVDVVDAVEAMVIVAVLFWCCCCRFRLGVVEKEERMRMRQ